MLDTTSRPDAASPDLIETDKPPCEHCHKPFEARSGSGGKPQRFCSPECRTAFHNEPQRCQRSPTCIAQTPAPASELPLEKPAPAATVDDSADFDWSNDDSIILREQPQTAIYFNAHGGLVIRQRSWPDDDVYVYINAELIDVFIDKLTDIIGVPSVGRRS
jgi:hypothetical protein